jgi:FPC/CPF motif-containing protein YcgG
MQAVSGNNPRRCLQLLASQAVLIHNGLAFILWLYVRPLTLSVNPDLAVSRLAVSQPIPPLRRAETNHGSFIRLHFCHRPAFMPPAGGRLSPSMFMKGRSAQRDRTWNPLFNERSARCGCCVAAWDGRRITLPLQSGAAPPAELTALHAELQARVLDEGYPCVGARAVFSQKRHWFGLYPPLGSAEAARAVCHDLYEYNHRFPRSGQGFIAFLAGFDGPEIHDEYEFEQLLWAQLQAMHEVDRRFFSWDSKVSADPQSPMFSFSIGSRAFFIIGMHGLASRKARTLSRPMLVFNPHEQFEALRARGKFTLMRNIIRSRDLAYDGTINPVLQDHGEASEARQYSGRSVSADWACPFHAKPNGMR